MPNFETEDQPILISRIAEGPGSPERLTMFCAAICRSEIGNVTHPFSVRHITICRSGIGNATDGKKVRQKLIALANLANFGHLELGT